MGSRARKYSIALAAAVAALTLAGCPKKESPEEVELAAQEARKAAQERKKKVDVFDEFYVDEAKKMSDSAKGKGKGKTDAPAAEPKALAAAGGTQKFSGNGRYVVQVNSTASESGANKIAAKMKGLGYPAYVVAVQNPTPELIGTYFRVRLGGFDSYSDAKAFAESTLEPAGYDYWIDRKANDNVGIQGGGFGSPSGQPQYPAAPPPQQYQPAPAPAPARAPAPAPAQGYQPAPPPAQGYQPAPAPVQQAAPPPPRPVQPAAQPQQQPQAQTAQPAAAKPQQPPPAPAPAPAPAQQPPAKQQQPAPAPAPAPAAKPQQPANDWGTGNDWGTEDW
jgi:cell division septation protein DedD